MARCIYCGDELSDDNVYLYQRRKHMVDKCDACTDRLESGCDMYP